MRNSPTPAGAQALHRSLLVHSPMRVSVATLLGATLLAACSRSASTVASPARTTTVDSAHVYAMLSALSSDSMEGRMTGSAGGDRAARWIAEVMREVGLSPVGDSGFFQPVPLKQVQRPAGARIPTMPVLAPSFAALDTVPSERRLHGANVVGVLRGGDPVLRDEAILVDAHYDHLGMGPAVDGDSVFNGADDDASGTVAVLEIARVLKSGPPPRRTIVFLVTTGEEWGLLGTRWYIQHPVHALERTVANIEIEMIGRPDSLSGGRGKGWLTGYERSTMGEALAAAGIPLVADMRLDQEFFMRSDNIAFARLGIPAHTLSSFNLHSDYHRRTDDVSRVDAGHMAQVIDAAARAVRLLANGPKPEWKPGGRPAPSPARP